MMMMTMMMFPNCNGPKDGPHRPRVFDNRWHRETHCTALAFLSLELPLMSNATAKTIFTCKQDLDAFLGMYLTERQTYGAGASQPRASAPPLLTTPTLPLMSQDDLIAKFCQALLGTDGGASQPANPSKAAEEKREAWPGLWRLMPEWREIVIQNNGVSKFFGSDAHMGRS